MKNKIAQKYFTQKKFSVVDIVCIAVAVMAVSGVAFFGTLHAFPVYWMIHAAINIAVFVLFINITSNFVSEINMRYEKPGE